MEKQVIEECIEKILRAIGENPEREGLKETPARVAKMFTEIFEGIQYRNDDIVKMFDKTFKAPVNSGLVIEKDIECFSWCEHHLALIYNMKISIGYIPRKKIIGLSKLARIADLVCKRLQVQERIGSDILYIVKKIVDTEDVGVYIEAEHSCMTARGIKKPGSKTCTFAESGIFNTNSAERKTFMEIVGK